ncbi:MULTISPECIES: hypothetical protein [Halolamina]|uniref:Uncharacterized protein n=1 Tax=Halolamina pelagica TaxID=699431 RepID=A0A1I5RRK3_9EURY|nr:MULTISPECIES: hypothetical protein [Halolamina]NHX35308.1 hypothetical protein [Halolamina sp. R1-12]SFP61123.1 hypothetical protein SAMN05216277_105104 [Halolamina pelagica]
MVLGLSGSDLFGAALVAVGAVVLLFSARYVRRAIGVVRARSVATLDGTPAGTLVRVAGTAREAEAGTLTAPFSGRESLVLRYAVEERRLSPYLLPWFVTIHERAGSNAFSLRTAEGVVDVTRPTRTVTLARDTVATVAAGETPPDSVARFEQRTGALPATTRWRDPPTGLRTIAKHLSLGTRRYTEERATPGDDVTVVGRVTDGGLDPVVVSDRPRTETLRRMAGTSLIGLAIGAFAVALGCVLLVI